MRYFRLHFLFISLFIVAGCSSTLDTPFKKLSPSQTNVHFKNTVENTPEFNIQNYLYFYDGGGVAVGDINNNGLPDLYFTGNMVSDRIYLNRGDFEFEDITESAGIIHDDNSWTTGVSMADITGNGFLDIYVSRVNYLNKSGANLLYINNGDNTFTERAAEYGLDFEGYSTQAAFFDYNNSGRLDLFLLNHSFHSEHTYGPVESLRTRKDPRAGDRLFRNDGDLFTDVTEEAGIISSALGYGLGLAISDITQNGYPDIYVGNDFHEDDYFYINNGDGTFSERVYDMFGHTSNSSMGNDIADINNNGRADVISLDMMAEDHFSFIGSVGPDLKQIYDAKKEFGFGDKNHRNTIQVNAGYGPDGLPLFSEIAFSTGIARTDWSWASLFADFDNNGYQDLFITNGMPRRPNDLDYVGAIQNLRQQYSGDELNARQYELIERMPLIHVANYMFKNVGNNRFEDITEEWGFSSPSYSSGAVYADLNGNGKLDLVVNNTNETAAIYKNKIPDENTGNYLRVKLNGSQHNTKGIGSKVFIYHQNGLKYREQMPVRGFQSSVDHILHFGLGDVTMIDSLLVIWPDSKFEIIDNPQINGLMELNYEQSAGKFDYVSHRKSSSKLLADISDQVNFSYSHTENSFDDFSREPLIPYKLSTQGPAFAVGDVNGNGLDDIYMGGSRGNTAKLLLQQQDGSFVELEQPDFFEDRFSEDIDAIFFDANGNGYLDLLVTSGGNEYAGNFSELVDRLYINDGEGTYARSVNGLPAFSVNSSRLAVGDFNGNGHPDIFIGGHTVPWRYGVAPQSFIFKNDGNGIFTEVTEIVAPELETVGMVTDGVWIEKEDGSLSDLFVVGEWMSVKYFRNQDGILSDITEELGLNHLSGLWQTVEAADLTGNGHRDIILGNFGTNSRMTATQDSPMNLYVNDFDNSGQTAPVITYFVDGREKPFEQLDELRAQIPSVTQRVRNYREYSQSNVNDLFSSEKLNEALQQEIRELRSLVLVNNGDGSFDIKPLPFEAQWFPVKTIHIEDLNGDGNLDLLIGGNLYDVKPSMGGRQDAGYGLLLLGDGDGNFESQSFYKSGFLVEGESRSIRPIRNHLNERLIVVARNSDTPLFFKIGNQD